MITIELAREIIDNELKGILSDNSPRELYEPIQYILSLGGKRLRPSLTLLSCNLFTEDIKPAIAPAIALEIFHNFTLVHDDIMDNATLRRGNETVHLKWGLNTAILSGDAMNIVAYNYILKSRSEQLRPILETFNTAALEVCEGQQLDMNFEKIEKVQEKDYLKMIELKTSVLLAACLKIGAIAGNADNTDIELMYKFGINMGIAFQLQDDLLDIYGNAKVFGKEIGKDITSNKKTYLLIKAFEKADNEQLVTLTRWIYAEKFEPQQKIDEVKLLYSELNIKEDTENLIDTYYKKALDNLEKINVGNEKKKELRKVLDALKQRES
jgi:geranylgeranyl diphosphate synthase, type II